MDSLDSYINFNQSFAQHMDEALEEPRSWLMAGNERVANVLSLPARLSDNRPSFLRVPSLSSSSSVSSSALDSRPVTPNPESHDATDNGGELEERLLRAPRIKCIPLPDVGDEDDFGVSERMDLDMDVDMDLDSGYELELEDLNMSFDRVAVWSNEVSHQGERTYAEAVAETRDEVWYGPLGPKTPKANKSALPARPAASLYA